MERIKSKLGVIGILTLSFVPVLIWLFLQSIDSRFSGFTTTLSSFGQIFGLVGLVMFALVLMLSGRFRFLEDYFGGMNRMYIIHHIFGGIAFILILFHPLLLVGNYLAISFKDAALFFIPSQNLAINLGIFSLLLFIILLVLTLFVSMKYEKWKFTHKFLGVSLFLAGLHSLLVPSDISRSAVLRVYMLGVIGASLGVYVYRTVLGFLFITKYSYIVSRITNLGESVLEIEMSPEGKKMEFTPGQFIFVTFEDPVVGIETHPFSITSASSDSHLKIGVKSLGDFTEKLQNLKVGTVVKIEGPFGRFYNQGLQDNVWIAGGIGITPFMSMIRTMATGKNNTNNYLFYCTRDEHEAVFLEEIKRISREYKNLTIIPFYSKVSGFITAERIQSVVGNIGQKEVFVCGPAPMMKSLKEQFVSIGLSRSQIHSEEFKL